MTVAEVNTWLRRHKGLTARESVGVTMALAQWAIAADAIGHFPSIRTFCEWSGESERTVERRSARIRAVLDEHEFHQLVGELRAGTHKRPARAVARPA